MYTGRVNWEFNYQTVRITLPPNHILSATFVCVFASGEGNYQYDVWVSLVSTALCSNLVFLTSYPSPEHNYQSLSHLPQHFGTFKVLYIAYPWSCRPFLPSAFVSFGSSWWKISWNVRLQLVILIIDKYTQRAMLQVEPCNGQLHCVIYGKLTTR